MFDMLIPFDDNYTLFLMVKSIGYEKPDSEPDIFCDIYMLDGDDHFYFVSDCVMTSQQIIDVLQRNVKNGCPSYFASYVLKEWHISA